MFERLQELLLDPARRRIISEMLPGESSAIPERKAPEMEQKILSSHYHREILIPLQGKYAFGFNGKFYECSPGSIFLIDHYVEHELQYTSCASGLTHLWLFVEPDKILGNCLNVENGNIDYLAEKRVMLRDPVSGPSLDSAWSELKNAAPEFRFIKKQKLLLALNWLVIRLIEQDCATSPSHVEYQYEAMENAKNYIRKNFKRQLDVAQLARIAGYSKFHFLRLFKKHSGCTVYEYINACRIKEVEMLLSQNYSQKEIAHQLGFQSASSFANWRGKKM